MNNAQIAAVFAEMAVLLELAGENPFRVRAYQRAAQTIEGMPKPIADVPETERLDIPGIGKGIAAHVAELLSTDSLEDLNALRKRFPPGILDLIKIPGLGPKRAKLLFDKLKIDSLDALKAAATAGRLRTLPGFGAKLEESVLRGLNFAQEAGRRKLYWEAKLAAEEIARALRGAPGIRDVEIAGSLRRGKETVGDLDVLCTAQDGGAVVEFFAHLPQIARVLAAGETKATVLLKSEIQCDLRVVAPESFGAALQYFTGSKDHNVALRELAQKKGLTINEYGLFKDSDKKHSKPLAGRTEAEIYERLGLQFIPPELRENRGEIEAAQKKKIPKLVALKDIRGDFHNHSLYTDGRDSLLEMARAAEAMGWEWVALGDHSRSLRVAKGLSIEDLRKTISELRQVQKKTPRIRLLRSMEVDILKDGTMDYPDDVLDEIDVVIGSVHSAFNLPEEEMTGRIQRALANPHVDMIGHLSGRLLGRREPYALNTEAVLQAGARHGAAFEINGQPQRQDLYDVFARRARELGIALAVTTDAHAAEQFQYMEMAVIVARRAWLTPKDILNCLGFRELQDWLERRLVTVKGD